MSAGRASLKILAWFISTTIPTSSAAALDRLSQGARSSRV
jgi:hypothetical protein